MLILWSRLRRLLLTVIDVDWLLIFDNTDDADLLSPYWPASQHGAIIITSRNPFSGRDKFANKSFILPAFDTEEGARFLRSFLDTFGALKEEDIEATKSIAHRFGGLPRCLRQAVYFMKNKQCLPTMFLSLYNRNQSDIEHVSVPGTVRQ
jgi:hypothetical protein